MTECKCRSTFIIGKALNFNIIYLFFTFEQLCSSGVDIVCKIIQKWKVWSNFKDNPSSIAMISFNTTVCVYSV